MATSTTGGETGGAPELRPVALVIEDEPALRRAMVRVLRPHFEVLPAATPAEAREVAGVRRIDLIVTDFAMPGENGVAGLRSLRALGHTAPALVVTAHPSAEIHAAIREGLASALLEKPWGADELVCAALRVFGQACDGLRAG